MNEIGIRPGDADISGGQLTQLRVLLDELQVCFPVDPVTPLMGLPEIYFQAGQQSVIEYLKAKL